MTIWLIGSALAVLVAGLVVLAVQRERARQAALTALASSGGWERVGRDDRWTRVFAGQPFGYGEDRRADDVCTRDVDGRTQVGFTYRYATYETVTTTDSGGNTSTRRERRDHAFAVLAVQLPARLERVEISREGWGDRFLTALGGQDIEIERSDFNRRYRVRADDAKLAVDLLNPRTVERLLAHADASVRLGDGWALVIAPGQLTAAFVTARLAVVDDLLAGVPRFVWLDHGFTPPG